MTIVSVASDLHLEFDGLTLPGGDILLLCGDTLVASKLDPFKTDADSRAQRKRYQKFCATELKKYWRVFAISGNHEFYGGVISDENDRIRDLFSEFAPNTQFLDNEWCEIEEGVRFIGSTLWATYGYGGPHQLAIQNGMNDFSRIHIRDEDDPSGFRTRKFTVEDANHLHQEALAYLRQAVDCSSPCVIMTHHSPTYLAINRKRFPDGRLDDAYASNLSDFILENSNIRIVCHGHSHYRYRAKIGDTKIAANPRGYYGHERMALGFDACEADFRLDSFEFVDAT